MTLSPSWALRESLTRAMSLLGRREESRGGAWSSSQTKPHLQLGSGYFTSGMPLTLPSGSHAFLLLRNFRKAPWSLQPAVTLGLCNGAPLLHQGFAHVIRVRITGVLVNTQVARAPSRVSDAVGLGGPEDSPS